MQDTPSGGVHLRLRLPPENAVIQLDGVAFAHPAQRGAPALSDLALDLAQGEFRWLTGGTGAGKSSLLGLLDTSHRPTAGRVVLLGRDAGRANPGVLAALRRRIGSVRGAHDLLAHLSVLENVALPLRINGVRAAAARVDATEMLHWVGLGARLHVPAALLSRGEAQLCLLARAVVPRPDLLLADEPFAGFSEGETDRMFALVREVARLGATVVIATRDERLPARYPAPALHLEAGRLRRTAPAAPRLAADRLVPAPPVPAPPVPV